MMFVIESKIARTRNSKGFTLIELMIGMIVGLIVLSAVGYAFISSIRSAKDVLNSSKLNSEVSLITDVVIGELRRTGYWPIAGSGESDYGTGGADDLVLYPSAGSASCVQYSYFDDANSPIGKTYRAFGWVSGATGSFLVTSSSDSSFPDCSSIDSSWVEFTDPGVLAITNFNLSLDCTAIAGSIAPSTDCSVAGGSDSILSRVVTVSMSISMVRDSAWKSSIDERVKLQNNLTDIVR